MLELKEKETMLNRTMVTNRLDDVITFIPNKIQKFSMDRFLVEVTRKCNMKCKHCLRGKAQSTELDLTHVDNLFKHVTHINSICFTGGEPSLAPHKIIGIKELIQHHKITLGHFGIVTNGKNMTEEFIDACNQVYDICNYKENCIVEISGDKWHGRINRKDAYEYLGKNLKCSIRQREGWDENENVSMGNAVNLNTERMARLFIPRMGNDFKVGGYLNLSALGNINPTCELSFNAEDQDEHIICHSSHPHIYEAINNYVDMMEKNPDIIEGFTDWRTVKYILAKPTA